MKKFDFSILSVDSRILQSAAHKKHLKIIHLKTRSTILSGLFITHGLFVDVTPCFREGAGNLSVQGIWGKIVLLICGCEQLVAFSTKMFCYIVWYLNVVYSRYEYHLIWSYYLKTNENNAASVQWLVQFFVVHIVLHVQPCITSSFMV